MPPAMTAPLTPLPADRLERPIDHLPMRDTRQVLLAAGLVDAPAQEGVGTCDLELVEREPLELRERDPLRLLESANGRHSDTPWCELSTDRACSTES